MSLLVLGDYLLSLGKEGTLKVWKIGEYNQPQVRHKQEFWHVAFTASPIRYLSVSHHFPLLLLPVG